MLNLPACHFSGPLILKFIQGLAWQTVQRKYMRLEWAVLDWNKPAIDFYKNLGAVAMDEWIGFRLTGDALLQLAGKE